MYPMAMKASDPNKFKRSFRTKYRTIPERTTVPAKMPFGTIGSNDSRYTLQVHIYTHIHTYIQIVISFSLIS